MTEIAKGRQGSWFATVKKTSEYLPCLKRHRWNGDYFEPKFYDPADRRNAEYIDAIKQGRVLVAIYERKDDDTTSLDGDRTGGYLNYVFTVADVQHDEQGLRCRIVSRESV